MSFPNAFDKASTENYVKRIEQLNPNTQPAWGKMDVAKMLAHCSVAYDLAFDDKQRNKAGWFKKLMLRTFVKPAVVGPKPYKKNSRTAPVFLISDERDFEKEKAYLIENIRKTQANGASFFQGRESASFGVITTQEWSNMFSKHLEHHLEQFGV